VLRRARLRPRPGRFRLSSDLGAKSRTFPLGAHRDRLIQALFPPTFDAMVVVWVRTEKPLRPVKPAEAEP
jgi:hypothetical protein